MTRYKNQVAASVPAARRDAINEALNRLLGCGPDTFWIPLVSPGGQVTHYGTQWRMTALDKASLQAVLNGNNGELTDNERIEDHAERKGLRRKRRP